VARSVLSKITEHGDMGAMFAIAASLETVSSLVSSQMATGLYAATVSFCPPLTFYVYAAVSLIAAAITASLQISWPQKKDCVPLDDNVSVDTQ